MLIINEQPRSMAAEAYRALRTSIQYSNIDRELKTIVVTSSVSGEGKSNVVANLGLALSEAGCKVLILDCNLREPTIHTEFNLSNEFGLTDMLFEKDSTRQFSISVDKNLDVITAGTIPPNPSEMLTSKAFDRFLEELRSDYEYILIDTTEILAVTDAEVLAGKLDGTILVVRENKTKERVLTKAYERLQSVNANVIGTVLTNAKVSRGESGYFSNNKRKRK